jgi:signal transduction histidine kinase
MNENIHSSVPLPISILLIEDNEHDRAAFERALHNSGGAFRVSVCEKAENALDMLAAGTDSYDLVVLDYDLPGMNGMDFYRSLKNRNNLPPFVMLTGAGSENLAVEALQAGMYDYIIKDPGQGYLKLLPFKLADVRQRRSERTARRRAQAELQKAHDTLEKRIAARTAQLLESRARLWVLSRKILEAQENERKRVAKEIHDGISGNLAAIKICLEERLHRMNGTPPEGEISFEKIISIINDTIQETRRISAHLRPSMLDDLGLISTIEWFCRRFERYHPQIGVERRLEIEEDEVPEQLKIVVYRILQEAMHNVAKHSEADRVHINLVKSGRELKFSVEDNGCGLDFVRINTTDDPMSGNGLANMRDRAEICGGNLEIVSAPQAGTALHLSLPLS